MKGALVLVLCALVCAALVGPAESARILVVIPLGAKSHHYVVQPLIRELVTRGHDVTYVTPISLGTKSPKLREILVKDVLADQLKFELNFKNVEKLGEIPIVGIPSFWPLAMMTVHHFLSEPDVQKLITSDTEKFDLVVLETHFGQELLLAFGHKFGAPVVSVATFSTYSFIDEFVGNPHSVASIPSFDVAYTNRMTFPQRVHNSIRLVSILLLGYYFFLPQQEVIMRDAFKYKGSENLPSIVEMLEDVALVITNSQIGVDFAKALAPNIIPAGGMHIANTTKPLPQDLKKFLDESKNGVIYFSFGSVVPSHDMPVEMRDAFLNAFRKQKLNVLWKLPLDDVPNLPSNVKLAKWLPQQDVLAHPNIKAFITHGGLLSQMEAVYYGVPLIGIAFFGDQYMNIERAAQDGFAISLCKKNITEEAVTWALNTILSDPSYKENIKKRSLIFRDNPETALERATFWVEYVIRHKGAHHLRPEGRKLSYVKHLLLDVLALAALVLIVVLSAVCFLLKTIYRCVCGGGSSKKQLPKAKQDKQKKQQ